MCIHRYACILTVLCINLPYVCVQIKFMGEKALDQGGPKRKHKRMLAIDNMKKLCIGSDDR